MELRPEEISSIIKEHIKGYSSKLETEEIGTVLSVGDGIARVFGLDNVMSGELVTFENNVFGIALNLEEDNVGIIILDSDSGIKEGSIVHRTSDVAKIAVGNPLIGRVINALGYPLDSKGLIKSNKYRPLESEAPGVIKRKEVSSPLQTGIKAIDSMVPIGKGQRELIIGDRKTGKTAICLDTIINQRNKNVLCIYVAIGQKSSTIARLVKTLEEHKAMEYTTVVMADAASSAAMQYIAPYAGCAIAEEWMLNGKDVLIVYDDLTKHAIAYRSLSLLLKRPPGREAYPGDVFYLHSRLLERAAKLMPEYGGGSITALPIIETQAGDISSFIPTNVISITDGQIFLETELFSSGVRPAVNPGLSVSRVGGSAQIKTMRKVSSSMRLDLAQYRELETFSQFASDLDEDTIKRLEHGKRIIEILKQDLHSPLPVEKQVIILYAMTKKFLSDIAVKDIKRLEDDLFRYLDMEHKELLRDVAHAKDLSKELEDRLIKTINDFKAKFV